MIFFFILRNGILCVLVEAILMRTHNIPSCWRKPKRYPYYASWPGSIINPQWLELPLSRTNFYSLKGVRAIEVRLYIVIHSSTTQRSGYNMSFISKARFHVEVSRRTFSGTPKFCIALYDKINHGLVNLSCNCDLKSSPYILNEHCTRTATFWLKSKEYIFEKIKTFRYYLFYRLNQAGKRSLKKMNQIRRNIKSFDNILFQP